MCSVQNLWTNSVEQRARDTSSSSSGSNSRTCIRSAIENDVVTMASTEQYHCGNRIAHFRTHTYKRARPENGTTIYGDGRCQWFGWAPRTVKSALCTLLPQKLFSAACFFLVVVVVGVVVIRCETLRVFNFYTVDSHRCLFVFFASAGSARPLLLRRASFLLVFFIFCFLFYFYFLILPFYRRSLVRLSHYFQPIFFCRIFSYSISPPVPLRLALFIAELLFSSTFQSTWTYMATVKTKLFRTTFSPRKIPFVSW